MINVATQCLEDPTLRNRIISKCHQGIGWLVVSAPEEQRVDIDLSQEESHTLAAAVRHRQRAISKQKTAAKKE